MRTPENTKDKFYVKDDGVISLSQVLYNAAIHFGVAVHEISEKYGITTLNVDEEPDGIGQFDITTYIVICCPLFYDEIT